MSGEKAASEPLARRLFELSMAFGVLCRFTAIVAIDTRHPGRKTALRERRRIVQPVESSPMSNVLMFATVYSPPLPSPPAPACINRCMPPSSHVRSDASADLFEAVRLDVVMMLTKAKPRSGVIGDMKPRAIRGLLRAVVKLLKKMETANVPRSVIESLTAAFGRLSALPDDGAAIEALLDVLADVADMPDPGSSVTCWWRTATGSMAPGR